ncbi:uncharacterized protein TNCV_2870941 [Trichonephila clavipes]|nr:uncharacterized protein TNCV_2870941 [Trichonephila clavipes]
MRNLPFRRTQRPKSNKIIPCKTNSGPPAVLTGEGIKVPCIFEAVCEIYQNIFGLANFEKVDRFRSEIQLAGHPVRGLKAFQCNNHIVMAQRKHLDDFYVVELLDDWNVDVPSWKYPRNFESPRVSSPGFGNDSNMMVMLGDVTAQVAFELQRRMRTGIWQLLPKEIDGAQHQTCLVSSLQLPNFRRDLTLYSAKLEIKRIFRESVRLATSRVARDKPWSTLCKKSHGIPSSPRAAAVAKFRLLTGHDRLCAHLFRFNLVTSPICVLCDTGQDMTTAHLDEFSALNDLNCIVKRYWRARCLMT